MGTLEVRVTDAPDPSTTAVYVTTYKIEVSAAGEGWITVIDEEITFELLALEGVEAILGTGQLATGKYTQVRLSVPVVEVEKDGELIMAEVPSDTIKLVGTFEIVDDFKTFISLDFEVDKSLVDRQRQLFLFKPVIKLVVGDPGEIGSETVELTDKPEKAKRHPELFRPGLLLHHSLLPFLQQRLRLQFRQRRRQNQPPLPTPLAHSSSTSSNRKTELESCR